MNFPPFNLKGDTASINNSVNCLLSILSKLRYSVCVWDPLKADETRVNFSEITKKLKFLYTSWNIFWEKNISSNKSYSKLKKIWLIKTMGTPYHQFQRWFTHSRCGRKSTSDTERFRRPNKVITPGTIESIDDILLTDWGLKVCEIEAIGISHGLMVLILKDYLSRRKEVAGVLTIDHQRNRVTTSSEYLVLFNRNRDEYSHRFITMDPPQHTGYEAAVEIVGFPGQTSADMTSLGVDLSV